MSDFYTLANQLDSLKGVKNPTKSQTASVIRILDEPKYQKYFFEELETSQWIEPLFQSGLMFSVPSPIEDKNQPGYFSLPFWYAGEYLARFAQDFPLIVRDVALAITTENARAHRTMLLAMLKVPPKIVSEIAPRFDDWANLRFSKFMMLAHELGMVMEYLAKGEEMQSALLALSALIYPMPGTDSPDRSVTAFSRHDPYWLRTALESNLPSLTEKDPVSVANTLDLNLSKAISIEESGVQDEGDMDFRFWRLNIRPGSGRRDDLKNLLVDTLISTLETASEKNHDGVPALLEDYLLRSHFIYPRIAYYFLRIYGNRYPKIVQKAYVEGKESIPYWSFEFDYFVEAQFMHLTKEMQREWIDSIYAEIDTERFRKVMQDALENRGEMFDGETIEEKRTNYIQEWTFRQLYPISEFLQEEEKARFLEWAIKYPKPETQVEPGIVVSSFEQPKSPVEPQTLQEQTVEEVINELVSFPGDFDSFRSPSREGLADAFQNLVRDRYEEFVNKADLLIRDDLRFIYHTHFFYGLRAALEQKKQLIWQDLIALCEHLTSLQGEPMPLAQYEPGLSAAKLAMAQLIEGLFRTNEPFLTNDLLNRYGQVTAALARQPDKLLEAEAQVDSKQIDPRTMNNNLDAATQSLNSVRGAAMHGVILYGLYDSRKCKTESQQFQPTMPDLLKEVLEEKLNKTNDRSLAVHSVLGWYVPQLMYLDRQWTINALDKIFPLAEAEKAYFLAAWSAYIRFSQVYKNVFAELIQYYQRGLLALSIEDKAQSFDRLDERFADHILQAYIFGLIELDSADGLVRSFYSQASEEVRSHGHFWLSQVMEERKPKADDQVWERIFALWQWRAAVAFSAQAKKPYIKEIQTLSRLYKNAPVPLGELYPLLSNSIPFIVADRYYEYQLIIDYLASNAESNVDQVMKLLYQLVTEAEGTFLTSTSKENISKIFEAVVASGNKEAKENAMSIVNLLGERGDYQWRDYLDKLKQ